VQKSVSTSGPVIKSEFIYSAEDVPFPSCHASTIVETPNGLLTAWFGGTHEKNPDVGIWVSREENGKWTTPIEVVNGIQNDTLRYPTWNPVLYYENNKLVLFYKVGPDCSYWWGEMKISDDYGKTWSNAIRFPDNIWGPIRNKPVLLDNGVLLCPSSTEYDGWRVHMEWTADLGKTWHRTDALNNGDSLSAIQPTILVHPGGKLQILCRTKNDWIYSAWSVDKGETWTKPEPIDLPNNNSGIDAVNLKDGRFLIAYNHIGKIKSKSKRNILNLAISKDGIHWDAVLTLENDERKNKEKTLTLDEVGAINTNAEYSYPAMIQTCDGLVHITYTWRREFIKHVVLDPSKISSEPIVNGMWPENIKVLK
jgi:predicted neuraminidase